jgi:hypothetical protein
MGEQKKPQADKIEAMFVQSAHGLTSSRNPLTLNGIGHSTLFFADRPQRVVGHLTSKKFVNYNIEVLDGKLPAKAGPCGG